MKRSLLYSGTTYLKGLLIVLTITMLSTLNVMKAQVPGIANMYPPTGGFAIDGNLDATSVNGDWLQGTALSGGYVINADGSPVNPLMTFHLNDAYSPTPDDVFKGGKIYDNPGSLQWQTQSVIGKSDINHAFLHLTVDASTGDKWAIFSADRKSASGISYLDFEFLQNVVTKNPNGTFTTQGPHGGRTVGDFVVTAVFGNGSTSFQVYTWQASNTNPVTYSYVPFTGDLTEIAFAAENGSSIPSTYPVFGNMNYPANTYVEGAINLSGFIGMSIPCMNTAINTLFIKSKASGSLEATIQDFIEPIQLQSLMIGTATAGEDQTLCDEGEFTQFTVTGDANPVMLYELISTEWSVVSYTGSVPPQIMNPSELNTVVKVYGDNAVLRFTAVTGYNGDVCSVYDDLTLTVSPKPAASWIAAPGNITVACKDAGNILPSSLSYSNGVTGQCALSGSVTGVITGTYDECGGTLTQTWTYTDPWNTTISHVQTITVQPAPQAQFAAVSPVTITCDQATAYAASNLTYSNAGLGGCLIQGQVMGTLTSNYTECGGTITQSWSYTDDCGRTSTQTQTITVTPAPQAVFATPAVLTLTCAEAAVFEPTMLSYTNSGLGGCLIQGQVEGILTPSYSECGGTILQSWSFTDDCGRTSTQTQTITVTPAPQAQFVAVSPVTITCDQATTFTASNLTYSNAGLGGCLIQGQVMGTLTSNYTECGGTITQSWSYTDNCGRTSTQTQTITVTPAPQAQFADVSPVTITCDQATTFTASNLTYSNAGSGGCLIQGQVMGTLTSNYTECGGTITQSWSYTDNCGRTSTQTQTITVTPAPQAQFADVSSISITCDQAAIFAPSNLTYTNAGLGGCLIQGQVLGTLEINYTECGGTIIQSWSYTDDCGRTSTQTQTITVTPAPQAQFVDISPITLTCDQATNFAPSYLTYTNNGIGGCLISGQVMGILTPNYTECGGTITQSWSFTDDCGRTSTQSQIITVTPAPQAVFATPEVLTLTCAEAAEFEPTMLSYTNSGLGGCLIQGQVEGILTPSFSECGGTILQSWSFTDDCGRVSTQTQTITVLAAPQAQFAAVLPITISCNEATTFAPSYLTYTNNGLGGCLIQGEAMGTLTSNYTECGGTITQSWSYTDDCGRTSTKTQAITVTPAPQAIFATPQELTLTCDEATEFEPTLLGYTNQSLGGCLIEGEVLGTLVSDYTECGGTITQSWSFTDDCNRTITAEQEITVLPAPQAQFDPIGDITISCNEALNIAPSYLHYANSGLGGCLISGQVLGVITGSYTECGGTLTQTWTFTDDCNRVITQDQIITVTAAPQAQFAAVQPITITCAEAVNYQPSMLTYTNEGNGGCLIAGQALGVITGSFTECGGELTQTWSYTDDCGRTSTQVQNITVSQSPQAQFASVENISILCDQVQFLQPSYLAYSNGSTGACTISGEVLGVITGTYDNCNGVLTQTWTFTDDCGRTSTQTQTINIYDNVAPSFTAPANITIFTDENCNYNAAIEITGDVINESDNCSTGLQATYADVITDGSCTGSHIITRTWSLVDACGNAAANQVQIITVSDNIAPVVTTTPGSLDASFECSDLSGLEAALALIPSALDNCTTQLLPNLLSDVTTPDANCDNAYSRVRTWNFIDNCGNISQPFTQTITVTDNTAPVFTVTPEDVTAACDANGNDILLQNWLNSAQATDNCGTVTITNDYTGLSNGCGQAGSATVTFTATDECGNTATVSATFSIVDTQAPVINEPNDITVNNDLNICGAQINMAPATATDNCGTATVTNNITGTNNASGFYPIGTTTITWTAIDECGNTITDQTVVTVSDEQNPLIECPDDITVVADADKCNAFVEVPQPVVSDNCEIRQITNTYTHTDDASAEYPVGETIVWWTVVDWSGNTTNCQMTITVTDTQAPVINCPANIQADAGESCETFVNVELPEVIENCEVASLTNSFNGTGDASGIYPVGTTTVTWTLTDMSGNSDECTMTVTVTDNVMPTIECPVVAVTNNDPGVCGANITVDAPVVSDNCGVQSVTNNFNNTANASGFYPVGTTVVTWTVTDNNGNQSTCEMTVVVNDTEIPTITCPVDITETTDVNACGKELSIAKPVASDNCEIESIVNDITGTDDASGYYETGSTTINWTVTDIHGNVNTCAQTVIITDMEVPQITCPVVPTAVAGANCSADVVIEAPVVSDNCSSVTFTNDFTNSSNASGTYPAGKTIVTWTATDEGGNTNTCTMEVIVSAAPTAVNDNATTQLNTPVVIEPILNDTDCNNDLVPSTLANTTNPSNGSVMIGETGTFIYTPNAGFSGTDSFEYTICDAETLCSTATITITVSGPTFKLIANDDHYNSEINYELTIDNLENDNYGNYTPVITILENPKHGSIMMNNNLVSYLPDLNYVGNDSYKYILSDINNDAIADTATTTITIVPAPARDTVIIYNVITPDGDGFNDRFYIEGIEEYQNNEVLIFNRWGDQIRYFEGYDNTSVYWDGTSENGDLMPSATYYYIVKLRNPGKVYSGWVIIHGHE